MARRRKPLVTVRVAGRDDEERTMRLTNSVISTSGFCAPRAFAKRSQR